VGGGPPAGAKRLIEIVRRAPNARLVNLPLSLLASLLVVAGCSGAPQAPLATPSRSLGPGEQWVPVGNSTGPDGEVWACAGVGWAGGGHYLTGWPSDPRLVWMVSGKRFELEWPVGYSARFNPQLELLNARVSLLVMREVSSRAVAKCVWEVDLPCLSNDQRRPEFTGLPLPYCE
jgi:hypothetical protein